MQKFEYSTSPFSQIILKLAARCNINCSYCYWFRDESVYAKPKRLTQEVEDIFLIKLYRYLSNFTRKKNFSLVFHGGEPLLFGKQRFNALCLKLRSLQEKVQTKIDLSITTNGILIDEDWAKLFAQFDIEVTLSIDGPAYIHDAQRKDFKNQGTYDRVVKGLMLLREFNVDAGVLTVCSPTTDPAVLLNELVNNLDINGFDVLFPDFNHDDPPPASIANYYKKLFDLWYESYSDKIDISTISSISKGLLNMSSSAGCVGYGPKTLITLLTDGSMEVDDTLRIAGNGSTATSINILTAELEDIQNDPLWQNVRHSTLNLPEVCQKCEFYKACGGGPIQTRWSKANGFNNPSVYCNDLKQIFSHAAEKIYADMYENAES